MKVRQGYIKDGIGYIPLTQNKWAVVDVHNFGWLGQWNWFAHLAVTGRWYAVRTIHQLAGKVVLQYMARVIMGVTDPKVLVDHKNRNTTLDNRESNLRITAGQNPQNAGLRKDNKSGFKGVSQRKDTGKWRVQIAAKGVDYRLGSFDTALEAAQAYNEAALKYHGEFAVLNEI